MVTKFFENERVLWRGNAYEYHNHEVEGWGILKDTRHGEFLVDESEIESNLIADVKWENSKAMSSKVLSVCFTTTAYPSRGGFAVPKEIRELLGLHSRSRVILNIVSPYGDPIYHGPATLSSGPEIISGTPAKHLKKWSGQQITVWISP